MSEKPVITQEIIEMTKLEYKARSLEGVIEYLQECEKEDGYIKVPKWLYERAMIFLKEFHTISPSFHLDNPGPPGAAGKRGK